MTLVPSSSVPEEAQKLGELKLDTEIHPLEQLFYLGYTESGKIVVFRDNTLEVNVVFRTLVPNEIRDIVEISGRFEQVAAQAITERLETLARAIKLLNGMPLILTEKEREDYRAVHKKDPGPLDMARNILHEKIHSMGMIDALYEAYVEFIRTVEEKFDEAKKKLKETPSSS